MRTRVGLAIGAGLLLPVMLPGIASTERPPYGPPEGASGPPVAGCPTSAGWNLVQPSGPDHLSAAFDFNGDGWVCGRMLPGVGEAFGFTLMDNAVR